MKRKRKDLKIPYGVSDFRRIRNEGFYYVDKTDNSLSVYRFADKKAELLYSYLFDVFLVIAIIEAVIITITTYIVKRMVSERTNPRPKRV